jgi:hypothetical protein
MLCAGSPSINSEPNTSTATVAFTDGPIIVALAAVLFVVGEIEKRPRLGWRYGGTTGRA